ncbi:MAG: GWxTD domain-containing protein [Bacteroidota bacterium]|nr:GWxTD domain-containing protein [Bacteroidota bacterium]
MNSVRCLILIICLSTSPYSFLKAMSAFVQPVVFYNQAQPYVEVSYIIYPKIFGGTTKSNAVQLTVLLKNTSGIYKADKFQLILLKENVGKPILHLIRWELAPGKYEIESKFINLEDTNDELTLIDSVEVTKFSTASSLSDIQLFALCKSSTDSLSVMVKNNFYFEPLQDHVLFQEQYFLNAYFESYHPDWSNQKSLIYHFSIYRLDSTQERSLVVDWYKKKSSVQVDPFLLRKDVSDLPSGNYLFKVALLDASMNTKDFSEIAFTRFNPFWDRLVRVMKEQSADKVFFDQMTEDSLTYYVKAIFPIMSSLDVSTVQFFNKEKKLFEKRLFLYQFWKEKSDSLPLITCLEYMKEARVADQLFFSGFGRGFETDRGIMYLRYGKPNDILSVDHDNGAFPYEIWKYNQLEKTGQTNVRFLFYNPDLAGSDFRLLHSTARGERFNRAWEIELYKNAKTEVKGDNLLDATQMQDNFNRRAREYFEEF